MLERLRQQHRTCLSAERLVVWNQMNDTLNGRTAKLVAANLSLKEGVARRRTMETDLRKRDLRSKKLLEESQRLQRHMQHLTHRLLAAQEDKRKKLSSSLQDEIVQTLLGINVRLLTLKREIAADVTFRKDIACTQQLVEESIRSINQFAREIEIGG